MHSTESRSSGHSDANLEALSAKSVLLSAAKRLLIRLYDENGDELSAVSDSEEVSVSVCRLRSKSNSVAVREIRESNNKRNRVHPYDSPNYPGDYQEHNKMEKKLKQLEKRQQT